MTTSQQPLLVIRPRGPYWRNVPHEVVAARFMFWNMVKSAARAPYAGTLLGPVWTMLRPLVFLGVILLLKHFSGAGSPGDVVYPLYLYSGLVLWWYVVDSTRQASRSIFSYKGIITKIYFPRIIAPAVPVVARLTDLAIQLIPMVPLMIWYGQGPGAMALVLPAVVGHAMLLALGLGYLFAAISTVVKDVERLLDYILYVGLFLSPVIYSVNMLPSRHHELYAALNPSVGPLVLWRMGWFGAAKGDVTLWAFSAATTLVLLLAGTWLFSRAERLLSERVL